jgi:flagellar biosynthetic protein FlhB
VARSRDLAHLATVGGGGALLVAFAPALADWMQKILKLGLRFDAKLLQQPDALSLRLGELTAGWVMVIIAIGAAATALAVGASLASGGWNFTMKPMAPQFSKLNPLSGLGRMFSSDHLATVGKACLLALL